MTAFSVIIPTKDRPDYLGAAVASVLAQSCADFELLIVNDGTTAVHAPDDPRVHILDNQCRGAVAARNLGVSKARGTFIAFLDDDDVWTVPDHLACAHQSNADFFFADGMMLYPSGDRKLFARAADAQSLAHDNTILISAVCYRSALHRTLGPFDDQLPFYWDWDWYLRVARSGVVLQRRAEPVVDIRVHAQNMSGASNAPQRQANLDLLCAKHGMGNVVLKAHTDFV